jgi:hypothetical protein
MPSTLGFFLAFSQISHFFIKNQTIIHFSADFMYNEIPAARKRGGAQIGGFKI